MKGKCYNSFIHFHSNRCFIDLSAFLTWFFFQSVLQDMATKRTQLEDVLSTAEDLQKHSTSESDKQMLKEKGNYHTIDHWFKLSAYVDIQRKFLWSYKAFFLLFSMFELSSDLILDINQGENELKVCFWYTLPLQCLQI